MPFNFNINFISAIHGGISVFQPYIIILHLTIHPEQRSNVFDCITSPQSAGHYSIGTKMNFNWRFFLFTLEICFRVILLNEIRISNILIFKIIVS